MAVVLFYLCCFLVLLKGTNSLATRQDIHNLRNQLLTNYDKNLSPNINQTEPVTLYVSFGLFTIQEFDDVKGKLSILGGFNISWNDDRIVWDPRMYGNITYISLAEADVWIPVAVLGRPYDDFKRLGHDFIRIFYTYNGNAFWDVADLFEISCSADIAYYPFDRQMCEIFFVPFGYHPDFFSLKLPFDSMLYVNFTENGSWKLLSSSLSVDVVVGSAF
ncbi:acetylcholine receptor subunit beta-like [Argopecten irradians]|uniref:acetylcholine receptor subunit beta-like n=1 Tax=Argopecten irradians TaxID=31199 RepID=UPI0037171BC9